MNTDNVLHMTLRRVMVAPNRAYIYVLCSKENNAVYVGQTNDKGGVCGRLAGHVSHRGTLRKRFDDVEVFLNEVRDLVVWAFALPDATQYISKDETFREGVEYRVQTYLQGVRSDWLPYFQVVSNITAPPTVDLPETVLLANWICQELEIRYHSND